MAPLVFIAIFWVAPVFVGNQLDAPIGCNLRYDQFRPVAGDPR
jgi:hypothetical protein